MRILIATDGSESSEVAVDAAARRPWPAGSEIKVISVVETPMADTTAIWATTPSYFEDLKTAFVARASEALARAVRKLETGRTGDLTVTSEVIEGSPKHKILEAAEAWRADLILVGSHGYNRLERFLLGSVSQAVASHAHCSVEIVRRRADATSAEVETA